jgi:hypothetical protein
LWLNVAQFLFLLPTARQTNSSSEPLLLANVDDE